VYSWALAASDTKKEAGLAADGQAQDRFWTGDDSTGHFAESTT
jgi:hypothetical protein